MKRFYLIYYNVNYKNKLCFEEFDTKSKLDNFVKLNNINNYKIEYR